VIVKLLGLAPDSDQTIPGVLTNCSGVVPSQKGMKGAPSPADTGMASLAATCQGAALLTKLDGTTRLLAGVKTKLYEAGASTWTDVSRAASYTTAGTGAWRFAVQGNVAFAANGADTLQASVSSGAFSCVAGAPVANIVETVGKFVFAIGTSANAHGVQWCALGDYTSWSASIATQAGSDTLTVTPGGNTAGRRFGNTIIVYKKNSMYLGVYVGPPNVWEFSLIPGQAGAMSQEVVVNIGTPENPIHLFMGEDDFYRYDGSKPVRIGSNRIKRQVFSELVQSRYYACKALHVPKEAQVYFYYPIVDSVLPGRAVVYNYLTDQWGQDVYRQIEATTDYIASAVTYDGMGSLYATYNDFPVISYDLAFVGSTQISPAVFNTNHQMKTLTGPAGDTSFTTGDYGDPSRVSTATRVVPVFLQEPTSASLTNYYRMRTGATLVADVTTALSSGAFDFCRDARWHRLQMSFTGDWEMAAFAPEWERSGRE
jgi:hypothetical protein